MNVALWAEEGPWREALAAWAQARNGRVVAMGGDALLSAHLAPGVTIVPHLETLLRREEVEAIHLMAPPDRVPPLVRACLQAGRHVLLGSPPPPDAGLVEEMVQRGAEGEAVLLPVGALAPAPGLRRVIQMAGRGLVGSPRLLEVRAEEDPRRTRLSGAPALGPRLGVGGVLLWLGPAVFGQLPALLGEPLAVRAAAAGLFGPPGVEDVAWVHVRCTQGWCTAALAWADDPRSSVRLTGAAGSLRLDETGTLWLHTPELLPGEAAELRLPPRAPHPGAGLDSALTALRRGDRRALQELEGGLRVTVAAYRAAATGEVVPMDVR